MVIPKMLTVEEVAEVSRRSANAIRVLRAKGKGPKFVKVDGRLLASEDEVTRWLAGLDDDDPAAA